MGKAEGYVEDYLKKKTRAAGYLCYKFVSPGIKGVPDDIIIHNGRVTFIETKRISEMQSHGADVRVLNTRELVDKFILECKSEPPL